MKIRFQLVDVYGEHLMYMNGHNYIPNIDEDVIFNDSKNDVNIHELAKVVGKFYRIDEDTLTIQCEMYDTPNDYGYSQFKKYNETFKSE